jgi:isoleucyl-tRNA synthetase
MDYRASLQLPATSFPKRANAAQREPEQLERWNEIDLYARMLEQRRAAPLFILHDGPPYANGSIHLGHVLNRVLKDVVVKYKHMAGFRAPFVPGWDCHGLPIELQVEKEVGRRKKAEMPTVEVRQLCHAYAMRFVEQQRSEIVRLGVVGDWQHPYLTLDPAYEAQEIRELGRLADSGALYRRKKPVYWCASCETALAEAEVEYEEKRSASIYVKFPAVDPEALARARVAGARGAAKGYADDASSALLPAQIAMVAWTTTPWTLPANLALALNPELEYVVLRVAGEGLIVAEGLADAFLAAARLREDAEAVRVRLSPAKLEHARFRHPWLDREVPVVLGDHVTLESGTGVVHTAPGHGQEDYEIGLRYGLEVYSPVDAQGRFTKEVPELEGKKVFDADAAVLEILEKAGTLLARSGLEHSYPHCWRCKSPLLYRATEQWFVSMTQTGLRQGALEAIDRIEWVPPWGRERIRGMIESRPDWCISRQRVWGVPITAFHCRACGTPHLDGALAEHVAAIVAREGADAWFTRPAEELLPPGFRCTSCGERSFRKETDILDVWFDSGVSHAAVLERDPALRSPADVYLEGSDQHRGWFHTSLLTAVATRGAAPYKACLTHGFFLDGQGRKMSKSLGNVIAPEAILQKSGADVLRLWASAEDYRGDVRISPEILSHLVEAYRRLRNTARFLLGNLGDFDPVQHGRDHASLPELERWALDRLARVEARVREAYDAYEFHTVYHVLNNYCAVDLSALYLDVVKDRCYCSAPADPERRAAQVVMWEIVRALAGMAAPILSFLAEDIWSACPRLPGDPPSVLLVDFPTPRPGWRDDTLAARYETLLQVRSAVTKAIEGERQAGHLGHSLEAHVRVAAAGELGDLLRARAGDLAELFIVSQVSIDGGSLAETPLLQGLKVGVERASGEKCQRCWNYRTDVGAAPAFPGACGRCADVLARTGFEASA